MEKFWKKPLLSEYQECFDILNTESLIERETYKKFAIALFEIAKNQLDCKDCKLVFVDNLQNNLGFASSVNNTVTLNLAKMEKQTLYKTVSTIYHELTHLHQDKSDNKKEIDTSYSAEFPFQRYVVNDKFLPAELLGINPFLFYYTAQHEKEARDVGSECAMELFNALKEISQTKFTKGGTSRLIDRCIFQTQTRWDKENADYDYAATQIKAFIKQNPNFVHDTYKKIEREFINDVNRFGVTPNERLQYEKRYNLRIGALVLLGCDDKLKSQILNFISSNFTYRSEMFTTLVSITDSPYSTVSKNDFSVLFKFAEQINCPKDALLNLLVSWDKDYVNNVLNGTTLQSRKPNNLSSFKDNGRKL